MLFIKIFKIQNLGFLFNPIALFYAIPVFFLIYLISPFFLIRWHKLTSSRIGHYIEDFSLYVSKKNSNFNIPNTYYLDIFYQEKLIANKFLSNKISKDLIILPYSLIKPIDVFQKILKKNFPKLSRFEAYSKKHKRDGYEFISKISNHKIKFDKTETINGNKFLNSLGIKISDKIICINIHDGEYLNKTFKNINFDHHKHRISDFKNYESAIKYLLKMGYYVFRMGKYTKYKSNINHHRFIDYSNSNYRSDFLDIFLINKCYFYIGNNTGLDHVAIHFKKPLVRLHPTIEAVEIENKLSLILFKHHYDIKKRKMMTLSEIVNTNCFIYGKKYQWFESNAIKVIDHKPYDILNIIIEMDKLMKGNLKLSNDDLKLQKIFWEKFLNYDYTLINKLNDNQVKQIEYYKTHKINGLVSLSFLRNNQHWLNN